MALAQVVYQISTDADFATRFKREPERALGERGWSLSKEELAFLLSALTRKIEQSEIISLVVRPAGFKWL
jgi:hypothetical protein